MYADACKLVGGVLALAWLLVEGWPHKPEGWWPPRSLGERYGTSPALRWLWRNRGFLLAVLCWWAWPVEIGLRHVPGALTAILLAWWALEALRYQRDGDRIPLARNPLALFALSVQRLWRNRSFLWIVAACWALAVAYGWIQQEVIIPRYYPELLAMPEPEPGEGIDLPQAQVVSTVVVSELTSAFPRLTHGLRLGPLGRLLAPAIIAGALIWLLVKKPAWLPEGVRGRLVWAVHFCIACFILGGVLAVMPLVGGPGAWGGPWGRYAVLYPLFMAGVSIFFAVLAAPMGAFIWHLVLQIARGDRWSMRKAVAGMASAFPAIGWMYLLVYVLGSTPQVLVMLITHPSVITKLMAATGWSWAWRLHGYGYQIQLAVWVACFLVPWIVLHRGVGLRAALDESYAIFTGRLGDVLAFAVRYALLFAALKSAVRYLRSPWAWPPDPVGMVSSLLMHGLVLVEALVIASFYLALETGEQGVSEGAAKEQTEE